MTGYLTNKNRKVSLQSLRESYNRYLFYTKSTLYASLKKDVLIALHMYVVLLQNHMQQITHERLFQKFKIWSVDSP